MFSLYKKELHSFFYTPFAYTITALFMLLFSFSINNAITYLNSSTLQFSFPDILYKYLLLHFSCAYYDYAYICR